MTQTFFSSGEKSHTSRACWSSSNSILSAWWSTVLCPPFVTLKQRTDKFYHVIEITSPLFHQYKSWQVLSQVLLFVLHPIISPRDDITRPTSCKICSAVEPCGTCLHVVDVTEFGRYCQYIAIGRRKLYADDMLLMSHSINAMCMLDVNNFTVNRRDLIPN